MLRSGRPKQGSTSWFADPDYPVDEGLIEATEFAIDTLRPR